MSETARVFVSATSVDLGSYRRIVSDTLLKLDAQPVTQDHFAPDSRAVTQMLRERIAACDAVICLSGVMGTAIFLPRLRNCNKCVIDVPNLI
jgi:hypothetical protein